MLPADAPTDRELEAFLDEALPAELMSALERQLRDEPGLRARLAALCADRDAGQHSLGAIWRRYGLTCFDRPRLGSYLLGILPAAEADYLKFHVGVVGCRVCGANLADLEAQQRDLPESADRRRTRYFQSSAGYLRSGASGDD